MGNTNNTVGAIIVAAGTSSRMKGIDKVFVELKGEPLLARVINVFQQCSLIDKIVIVLSSENIDRGQKLVKNQGWTKVSSVCTGGVRRQDSVKKGLHELTDCEWVVIHDGARPCITSEIIETGLLAAKETGAAIAAVPAKDTIKIVSPNGIIEETPVRQNIWIAQTPQVFRYDLISEAYDQLNGDVTDDAALVEQLGHKVEVYMGSYQNIKITTPDDLTIATFFLDNMTNTGGS